MADHTAPLHRFPRLRRRTTLIIGGVAAAAIAAAVTATVLATSSSAPAGPHVPAAAPVASSGLPAVPKIGVAELAALPAATYNAVIPNLLAATTATVPAATSTGTLTRSIPLYGDGAEQAVARMDPKDFTGAATVVDVVRTQGPWALILTPARQQLPSAAAGHTAAAQTAAWTPVKDLGHLTKLTASVEVSEAKQSITIHQDGKQAQTFTVGVGTKDTPTPVGVTGYLEARFVNPADGTGTTPINLTSLHSARTDTPAGSDGGLIAMHYYPNNTGAVSHGCIRLTEAALAAVNTLPLGTPITITD